MTIAKKSLVEEGRDIALAIELINMGARLPLLEAETRLSRERLISLYKELTGISPPKGMLPYSTDWFLTWQPNVHSSIFFGIYDYLRAHAELQGIDALKKSYRLYLELTDNNKNTESVLSLTRAWTLTRFVKSGMLSTLACKNCKGVFVVDPLDLHLNYICGLCNMPTRAGKTKALTEKETPPAVIT